MLRGPGDPAAEAAVRKALKALGIPCWGSEAREGAPGRYGILFRSGRRAMVLPLRSGEISLDLMAAARCDYLILADSSEDGWRIPGFVYWFEAWGRGLTGTLSGASLRPRPLESFPERAMRPARRAAAMLSGSFRLLLAGDPPTPDPIDPGSVSGGP